MHPPSPFHSGAKAHSQSPVELAFLLQFRTMFRRVSGRLGAARLVLHDHVGKPTHAGVSKLQLAAMVEVLADGILSATERADLSNAALACEWHGQDAMAVLSAMVPTDSQLVKRRRVQQSYESILAYGTEELWGDLFSEFTPAFKLQKILELSFSLGLRCPTEPTIKFLCSWWIIASETDDGIRRMSQQQKHTFLLHCKSEINRARKMSPETVVHLVKLPTDPIVLLRDFPLVYHATFKHPAVPISPRIDVQKIIAFDMSYNCRGAAKHGDLQMVVSSASSSGSIDSALQKVTETLASQQQFLMQMIMGGMGAAHGGMGGMGAAGNGGMNYGIGRGGIQYANSPGLGALPNGNSGRPARSLRCLVNDAMLRGDTGSHTDEMAPANRPAVIADGFPEGLEPLQRAPPPVPAALPPTGSSALAQVDASSAHAEPEFSIDRMLDMVSDRDDERKAIAAATKAAAKAAAKAKADVGGIAAAPPAIAKVAAKAPAKVPAAASAKAKAAAIGKAVAEPPPAIVAKAPAKAAKAGAGKAGAGKAAALVVDMVVSKISQHE
jgi:hypothetical protein